MNLNVNIAAIAIFVVTIAASLLALYARPALIQAGVFRPHQFARGNDRDTILTSGFLHADMGRLIFNMVTYFFFAFPPFPVPAPLFAIGYVAYSYYAAAQNQGRINHDAHLCGALSGIAFVLLTDPGLISRYLGSA